MAFWYIAAILGLTGALTNAAMLARAERFSFISVIGILGGVVAFVLSLPHVVAA